jgi:serine/threonine protein kinase
MFEKLSELGFGSFGTVFKVEIMENYISDPNVRNSSRKINETKCKESEAIKRIDFDLENKSEIIRGYLNFPSLFKSFILKMNIWLNILTPSLKSVDKNIPKILLYIQMEFCNKTIEDVINEFDKDFNLKTGGTLTIIGYYIASQMFIEILKVVNHLHKQNPPLIHRDLKPVNILFKKCESKVFCVNFGLLSKGFFSYIKNIKNFLFH